MNTKKPTIPEVIDRFWAYYTQNPTWGGLHIVLDDGNYADDSVQFCLDRAEACGDYEAVDLAQILLRMSKTQRRRLQRLIR